MGGALKGEKSSETVGLYLFLAILFALLVGLIFAINSVSIFSIINQGLNIDQANYDGNILLGIVFLVIFIVQYSKDGLIFTLFDFAVAQVSIVMVVLGVILFSRAIKIGKAGPVQSIQEAKAIVQTVLEIIFLSAKPNLLQIFGLIAGFVGVMIIVVQRKKTKK